MTDHGPSILVLSSHTRPHFPAPINHSVYCARHGYDYLFDATPYPLASPFDQKTHAIIAALRRSRADWIFWIDDDAFFTDLDKKLTDIVAGETADFVFCRSPVNLRGQWSHINAGLYFVRNTPENLEVMEEVLRADNDAVRDWWDADRFGMYTIDGSDQEKLLYVFERRGMLENRVRVLGYEVFNARPYHYRDGPADHFICHLASHMDKYVPYLEMQRRFGLDRYLLGPADSPDEAPFRYAVFARSARPKRKRGSPAAVLRAYLRPLKARLVRPRPPAAAGG